MTLSIPQLALVVLIGPSGAGKTTFARRHFLPTEVVSSDACRALVADDENDQTATEDAFAVLHAIVRARLKRGRLTVVDATNVQSEARRPLVAIAREQYVLPVALVFDLPEALCRERNRARLDRALPPGVVRRQSDQLRRSLRGLEREGFRQVHVFRAAAEVDGASVARTRLWPDRSDEHGPFDIIGDVHGCFDELRTLLIALGYEVEHEPDRDGWRVTPPAGRKAVFLGDLVDRGPRTPDVLRLVMAMVAAGTALCVPGNHEQKLVRRLRGRNVQVTHGLEETLEQLAAQPPGFSEQVATFLDGLVSHYVLDGGNLVVAHAGMKEAMQGRAAGAVREFALYGETTGETDEYGLPVRHNWAAGYRGRATVVYGHTPVPEPEWLNNTLCIDTGCVFGGRLTALRYPEREIVSVPAARVYYQPARPFPPAVAAGSGERDDDLPDIADVTGKRLVETRLHGKVTVREENAAAALEVMSRWAIDPRWLITLPPTMSPVATSSRPDLLEHPAEAFEYYRREGVARVVCQEKHMGSRAVVIVCRDEGVARRRFRVVGGAGVIYTRTGRPFFEDPALMAAVLDRVCGAATTAGLWERLATDWLCFDCELMPWSLKARDLIQHQYAATAAAARAAFPAALTALARAAARGVDLGPLPEQLGERAAAVEGYYEAYGRYCWPVESLADLRLAPFHLLASEGAVHLDQDHAWHIAVATALADADQRAGGPPVLMATDTRTVDLDSPADEAAATEWWSALTDTGGEGMVVKPETFLVRGRHGLVQPAVKVRGREYLRIIYGPEYTLPANVERLRQRNLGHKRSLALRELALGVEALERFVRGEPLYRVHECVFALLALESEPVDPRL